MANRVPGNDTTEKIVELPRVGGLSDSVYAFALTLLVLEIRLPDDVLAGDLPANLLALLPRLLVYLISFIVIGGAWGSHQRMLSQIKRGDGLLVWFNLLSLLFITLMPASANILARFPQTFAAIVLFALNVIFIQLSALLLWRHASKNQLVNPALDQRVIIGIGRRLVINTAAFTLSVLLALLNPLLVYIVWIGLFLFIFTTDWLSWQQGMKTRNVAVPLDGAARGEISIQHRAGVLHIHEGGGSSSLVEGTFGGGVDSHSAREGDVLKMQLNMIQRRGLMRQRYPWAWGSIGALDWKIALNPTVPLKLNLQIYAGVASIDFRNTHLEDLTLETSASAIEIWLPANVGQTTVKIEGENEAPIIHVPSNVAARIRLSETWSGLEIDLARFPVVVEDQEYCSPGYDTAANKVDIQLKLVSGSARID